MNKLRLVLAVVFLVGIAVSTARANTITPGFIGVTDNGDGTYLWEYKATLENGKIDGSIATAQFFTLYDLRGYIAGSSAAPSGWTPSDNVTGLTPGGVFPPPDALSLTNVTFSYSGGLQCAGGTGSCSAVEINLGTFSFLSTIGSVMEGRWSSQDLSRGSGAAQPAVGFVEVPVPDGASTVLLFGSALCALGFVRRKYTKI